MPQCLRHENRKSTLRKPNGIDLGPQYTGTSISRDAIEDDNYEDDENPFASPDRQGSQSLGSESDGYADPDEELDVDMDDNDGEINSDDAFESGDEEKFQEFSFKGSKKPSIGIDREVLHDDGTEGDESENIESSDEGIQSSSAEEFNGLSDTSSLPDDQQSDLDMDDESQSSMSESKNEPGSKSSKLLDDHDERALLRKMMAEDQKTVAASFSKAAKADIEKGKAIKQQRKTFDSLLNTRIKLQKALVATNSMSATSTNSKTSDDHATTIKAAETAALNLWTSLNDLRSSLLSSNPKKRPFSATTSTPASSLWTEMQSHEANVLPTRRSVLLKWSQKTNPAATLSRPNKFSQEPTLQPLPSVIDQHLLGSNMDKLVARTRIPRSCAPLQAAQKVASDPNIYDDADLYALLLQELVDQRMASSSLSGPGVNGNAVASIPIPSRSELKVKKQVDTNASKGRKMRYTVQEKLQNFMAPEDRCSWGERQRGELFGSLLGRKVVLDEGDGEQDAEIGGGEGEEAEGLRLFGR